MKARDLINSALQSTGYRITKSAPETLQKSLEFTRDYVLAHRLVRNPRFFFVQIGANDGVTCDDIHDFVVEHGVPGIVVEPLPDLFETLEANYRACPGVICVNRAIHRSESKLPMYRVRPDEDLPEWCRGVASFDRDHLVQFETGAPGITAAIVAQEVACTTLEDLLDTHDAPPIDLLQIDTEGYDAEILRSIDFTKRHPAIIRYERKHLGKADQRACAELLIEQGYRLFDDERKDVVAYDPATPVPGAPDDA